MHERGGSPAGNRFCSVLISSCRKAFSCPTRWDSKRFFRGRGCYQFPGEGRDAGEVSEGCFPRNPVAYEVYRRSLPRCGGIGLRGDSFFVEPDGGTRVGDGLDVGRDFPTVPGLTVCWFGAICLFLAGDFRAGGRGVFFLPDEGND